jgi:hypothetical protein
MLDSKTLIESIGTNERKLSGVALAAATETLRDCEQATIACSTAMLALPDASQFAGAIARDLDCADVVAATQRVLVRRSGDGTALLSAQLEACLVACERSNEMCATHACHHDHCRICAEATRRAAETCQDLLKALHE